MFDSAETERSVVLEGDVLDQLKAVADSSCALVVSSPPYNIGKSYERRDGRSLSEYRDWQRQVIECLRDKITDLGSICWQVGTYVEAGEVLPLDMLFGPIFSDLGFKLRNRIIWRYNFGLNAERRFSGRYETVLWYSKTEKYRFNLDPVRVPQLYPGKRHSRKKGDRAGKPSGNPNGKNPSDYWEFSAPDAFLNDPIWQIPNVKSNHVERTAHPCQFPIELAERCVLALSQPNDLVLDPFVGTGATMIAALKHGRRTIGIERDQAYVDAARSRIEALKAETLQMRPSGLTIRRPRANEKVARIPSEWAPIDKSEDE